MKANQTSAKNIVFIGTGSNLGDRKMRLQQARELIRLRVGKIIKASSIYETAPWGHTDQPDFYNEVLKVETTLSARQLMKELLSIEKVMDRKRTFRYAPREIDIDILFFNHEIVQEDGLVIPHPLLHERNFVLAPLTEIAPGMIHPVLKKKIKTLAHECTDPSAVKKIIKDIE